MIIGFLMVNNYKVYNLYGWGVTAENNVAHYFYQRIYLSAHDFNFETIQVDTLYRQLFLHLFSVLLDSFLSNTHIHMIIYEIVTLRLNIYP